jgi:hypothetical protein
MADQTLFKIRLYKKLVGAPDDSEWSNEYEIEAPAAEGVEALDLTQAVADLERFEKTIHTFSVEFRRAVVSTIAPDDQPSQDGFRVLPLSGVGSIAGNNNNNKVLDLGKVLVISFTSVSGRASRHQYRGALDDQSTILQFGAFRLSGINQPTFINAAQTLASSATGGLLRIVNVSRGNTVVRTVTAITVQGVGSRQTTARRKPKISLDDDAIITRLRALLKEASLVNASIQTKNALGGLEAGKAATANLLVRELNSAVSEIGDAPGP